MDEPGTHVMLKYTYGSTDLYLIIEEMHGAIENIKFYIPPPPNFVMPQFSASGTHTIVGSEIVGEAPGSFDLKVTHSQSATISTVRICVPEAYWGKIYTYLYKLQHGALDAMWEPFQHPAAPEGGGARGRGGARADAGVGRSAIYASGRILDRTTFLES